MPHSITFDVSPEVGRGQLLPTIRFADRLASSLRSPIEAMSPIPTGMIEVSDDHALLSAAKHAFYGHYLLQLSPDVIWLTLARNFALHVLDNAEQVRHRFVAHDGKMKLVVTRLDFLPDHDNPWEEVFADFSNLVAEQVGKLRNWIQCDFSTTGPVERVVSDLMVMETFEPYFEYEMLAGCGIPQVTLLGTVDDWKSLRQRAALFGEFGLELWCNALDPVLSQFERAAGGEIDQVFWQSMFRYRSGSGPAVLTGWLTCLFPYLQDRAKRRYPNPALGDWQERWEIDGKQDFRDSWQNPQGVGLDAYPACLTNVPLKVRWGSTNCQMRIVGGLIGVAQNPADRSVQANAGWALTHGVDRSEWKYTTSRTIWPMIYELPDCEDFRIVSDSGGIVSAEAEVLTTLMGRCKVILQAKSADELWLSHSTLSNFFRVNLNDAALWREEIGTAMLDQGLSESLRDNQGWLTEPTIISSRVGRSDEVSAEFKLPGGSAERLRVNMQRRMGSEWLHVTSVSVVSEPLATT